MSQVVDRLDTRNIYVPFRNMTTYNASGLVSLLGGSDEVSVGSRVCNACSLWSNGAPEYRVSTGRENFGTQPCGAGPAISTASSWRRWPLVRA